MRCSLWLLAGDKAHDSEQERLPHLAQVHVLNNEDELDYRCTQSARIRDGVGGISGVRTCIDLILEII